MNGIIFTEEFCRPENFFPFTLTRQIQDIRAGILTIRQKWELSLRLPSYDRQEGDYKDGSRARDFSELKEGEKVYLIHGNLLPSPALVKAVKSLKPGSFLCIPEGEPLVYCISTKEVESETRVKAIKAIEFNQPIDELLYPWEIFQKNSERIISDFELLSKKNKSQKISSTNKTSGKNIFLGEGVKMEHCILNATEGPIFIGKGAQVMEGSLLRGPLAICEGAVVKMGTKIYGGTTVGPHCIVGGEIKNSMLFGYSNKAHDGYLGDSVIGEWCNLGAGTSNSNLKNNASDVVVYTPSGPKALGQKCGVLMGDYSRTSINTSINTGTVIGACANVFGTGLTPKYIPSFSWGAEGIQRYRIEKALADIQSWKKFKGHSLEEEEQKILEHIFEHY